MAEERIFELEDISIETSQTKKTKRTKTKKQNRISKNYGTTTEGVTYT